MDNDIYGHVSNVVYYSWFDTVINEYLIRAGGLDIHNAPILSASVWTPVVPDKAEFCFPGAGTRWFAGDEAGQQLRCAMKWRCSAMATTSALCRRFFVHVFVDRASNKSVQIPANIRGALQALQP